MSDRPVFHPVGDVEIVKGPGGKIVHRSLLVGQVPVIIRRDELTMYHVVLESGEAFTFSSLPRAMKGIVEGSHHPDLVAGISSAIKGR